MDSVASRATARSRPRVAVAVAVWLALALFIGTAGLLGRSPVPPPALAVALAVAVLLLLWLVSAPRRAVRSLGLRSLVAIHLVRVIAGAYFLVLYRRGVLPGEFALAAGWGDVAVGVAAVPVLWLCLPVRTRWQRAGLLIWNTAGLVDILAVLANAARLFGPDPTIGEPFTRLPLALLPLFVVPIVIASHVLIFAWAPRPRD